MKFKQIATPLKKLYMFKPGFGEDSFNKALAIRIHEIIAQKHGISATKDLGFIGCCAIAQVTSMKPEIWIDFYFKKASYAADDGGYSGKSAYFPRKELDAMQNYLFFGTAMENARVIVRDIPVTNAKGEIEDVKKKVPVLRIYGQPALCLATIVDVNILNPNFVSRFTLTDRGNQYMNEYVDPEMINEYLPIEMSVTVLASDLDENRYDPDKALMALQEMDKALIVRPSISKTQTRQEPTKAVKKETKQTPKKDKKEQKSKQVKPTGW